MKIDHRSSMVSLAFVSGMYNDSMMAQQSCKASVSPSCGCASPLGIPIHDFPIW